MSMQNIIEFQDVTKEFPGVRALNSVSFTIRKGEVHSLVGENGAGKSTLMKLLSGQYGHEGGTILLEGESINFTSQSVAIESGISTVYQELTLCTNLSVVQNIFLGREIKNSLGIIDSNVMENETRELLRHFGKEIDPKSIIKDLSIAEQQVIEIARAISLNAKVLILDEPLSSLTYKEAEILFENIEVLKAKGVSIIFVSHKLEEVLRISDRISVLRDGSYLGTYEKDEINMDKIVRLIAGDDFINELTKEQNHNFDKDTKVLEVQSLKSDFFKKEISFNLHKGEILGFYGLQGSGRTELMESLFGLRKYSEGIIKISNRAISIKNPLDAIKNGLAMVTEDRRDSGIIPDMNVAENICLASWKSHCKVGFMQNKTVVSTAREYKKHFGIKVPTVKHKIKNLSGGNQQKALISKWLSTSPAIIIMDEPTRGIDIGAKTEIYKLLRRIRNEGMSVIIVSSELPEVIAECDRVIVMANQKITSVLEGSEITKENILANAMIA